MGDLTKNFSIHEFACNCGCGEDGIDPALVIILQSVRDRIARRMVISSGVRCKEHNEEVGGVQNSEHITGYGVDVACSDSRMRHEIVSACMQAGVPRIGIGKRFIHIGVSPDHPKDVLWLY